MQAVDPSVSLAYWDYSRETVDCPTSGKTSVADKEACFWEIWDSEMFTADFFGSKGPKGVIGDGRWKAIEVPVVDSTFFDEAMIEGALGAGASKGGLGCLRGRGGACVKPGGRVPHRACGSFLVLAFRLCTCLLPHAHSSRSQAI